MAYDATLGQTVLFGGLELPERVFADTWLWNGRTWAELPDRGVSGRTHFGMAYDPTCPCVARLGGKDSTRTALSETWRLMDRHWQRLPGPEPEPRIDHDMVFDSRRDVLMAFGGKLPSPSTTVYADTWERGPSGWIRR
jgi:hypothetical protein